MNEMLYGNNGQNDECLNMDMDQALFARVKSKTFVHSIRKTLNPLRPTPDNSFIYMGSVEEKGNSYTLYGYQAKLVNDSRGGDYGNYVAVPCDKKTAVVDFSQVKFATEEGFKEFYTVSNISDANRFSVSPMTTPLNKNAVKLLINNILEMLMGTGRIANVSFCLSDEADEDFSKKAIYVLALVMKFIPYRMRKNIAFVSRIDANAKIPNMINVAAYASNNSAKPRDCVDVENECGELTTGVFKDYVNKVFSMDDASRKAYLDKLWDEIESPLVENNLVVKSSHYLLETDTRPLWETGSDDAIKDIFATVNEVATVFPAYTALAKKVMEENTDKVINYLANAIARITKNEEIKKLYNNTKNLFTACDFDITKGALPLFVKKADEIFAGVEGRDDFFTCADSVKAISSDLFGEVPMAQMGKLMEAGSFDGFYEVYSVLKAKKYISAEKLDLIAVNSLKTVVEAMISASSEAKYKLDLLCARYDSFAAANAGKDYKVVTEIYNKYKTVLSGSANTEAVKAGSKVIMEIKENLKYYNEFSYFAGYFEKLVKIDTNANSELKVQTERVYAELVDRFYRWLMEYEVSGNELVDCIDRITPCVAAMEQRGIYDGRCAMLTPMEKGVPDGIKRLMNLFKALDRALNSNTTLSDALRKFDELNVTIYPTETRTANIFKKHAPVIVKRWAKNGKFKNASGKDLEGALKKLKKDYTPADEMSIARFIERFDAIPEEKGASKKGGVNVKLIVIIAIAFLIMAIATVGVLWGVGVIDLTLSTDPTGISEGKLVDKTVIDEVEDYLATVSEDWGIGDAEIIVGEIDETGVVVTDKFEATVITSEGEMKIRFSQNNGSKRFFDASVFPKKVKSAFVCQKFDVNGEKVWFAWDAVILPEFSSYDMNKDFDPGNLLYLEGENKEEKVAFYNKIVKYVGVQLGEFEAREEATEVVTEEKSAENEQK